jgi:hypothetical protein
MHSAKHIVMARTSLRRIPFLPLAKSERRAVLEDLRLRYMQKHCFRGAGETISFPCGDSQR